MEKFKIYKKFQINKYLLKNIKELNIKKYLV